jgi:hypothetical protein
MRSVLLLVRGARVRLLWRLRVRAAMLDRRQS